MTYKAVVQKADRKFSIYVCETNPVLTYSLFARLGPFEIYRIKAHQLRHLLHGLNHVLISVLLYK